MNGTKYGVNEISSTISGLNIDTFFIPTTNPYLSRFWYRFRVNSMEISIVTAVSTNNIKLKEWLGSWEYSVGRYWMFRRVRTDIVRT